MLAGMVNISFHRNSPSCLVPPITTLCSELISSCQFFLPSLINKNPLEMDARRTHLQRVRAQKKHPYGRVRWQRPIFPWSCPHSIIGAEELNYRVRDGNGCTLFATA